VRFSGLRVGRELKNPPLWVSEAAIQDICK